jgi:surface carbohydrate biosynthesis protein
MKKFIKFLKSKKHFNKPKKKKYLILDSKNSFIFKKYLNQKDVDVLDTRYESFNLYVLIKTILQFNFSFNSYIVEYIKSVDCEFIISFIDNNVFYYEVKKYFPNKKVILIQNGMRTEFFFKKLSKISNLKIDYLLTFNDFYSEKYKQFVEGKFVSIGSFKNNLIPKNEHHQKNKSIAFISSGPTANKNMNIFEKINLKIDDYFLPEKKLLPIISDYCKKHGLKLIILARSKLKEGFSYEKNFYKKILINGDFEFIDTLGFDKIYKISDISLLTVSIYSAFGLECLGRGNRTVIFNVRDKATKIDSLNLFWSNNKVLVKGPFWSDEVIEEEVDRTFNFSINCSDIEWKQSLQTIKPFLVMRDNGNQFFKNLLIKNE